MAPTTRATSSTSLPSQVTGFASTARPAARTSSFRWASSRCTGRAADLVAALVCLTLALPAPGALAATVPPGFQETLVVDGLTTPAALAFSPDGRLFVTEQATGKL